MSCLKQEKSQDSMHKIFGGVRTVSGVAIFNQPWCTMASSNNEAWLAPPIRPAFPTAWGQADSPLRRRTLVMMNSNATRLHPFVFQKTRVWTSFINMQHTVLLYYWLNVSAAGLDVSVPYTAAEPGLEQHICWEMSHRCGSFRSCN